MLGVKICFLEGKLQFIQLFFEVKPNAKRVILSLYQCILADNMPMLAFALSFNPNLIFLISPIIFLFLIPSRNIRAIIPWPNIIQANPFYIMLVINRHQYLFSCLFIERIVWIYCMIFEIGMGKGGNIMLWLFVEFISVSHTGEESEE